jgi:hypothetical protein
VERLADPDPQTEQRIARLEQRDYPRKLTPEQRDTYERMITEEVDRGPTG